MEIRDEIPFHERRMKGLKNRKSPGLKGNNALRDESESDEIGRSFMQNKWKWILFGSAGFVFVFLMSLFFAAMYVHKKEATLKLQKPNKIVFKPVVLKDEKKHIIKRYDLSPFFLRLKNPKTGKDHFLATKLYIEFVSRELPDEIKAKKELLRTLIYRQLKKHFTGSKPSPEDRSKFERELVPILNIFFKGGGVYAVGFNEFKIR